MGVDLIRNKTVQILLAIVVIAALTYFIAFTGEPTKPVVEERAKEIIESAAPRYNYTPGVRPDYGLPQDMFKELPPLPQDFWEVDERFYRGEITDFVELNESYWKQPEFYPTFENNLDFIRSPRGGVIYAYGVGAYPGDMGVDVFPDVEFSVATFFYSSWLVETYQGMGFGVEFPSRAEIPTPDLQGINFTVTQNPEEAKKYFNVTFDPPLYVIGPSAPVFHENWTMKLKMNIIVKNETPKGVYIIGVNAVAPPIEYSELWVKTYPKYSDAGGFRIGRPSFQLIVFVN